MNSPAPGGPEDRDCRYLRERVRTLRARAADAAAIAVLAVAAAGLLGLLVAVSRARRPNVYVAVDSRRPSDHEPLFDRALAGRLKADRRWL